jgi:hypothetical protein
MIFICFFNTSYLFLYFRSSFFLCTDLRLNCWLNFLLNHIILNVTSGTSLSTILTSLFSMVFYVHCTISDSSGQYSFASMSLSTQHSRRR